MLKQVVNPGEVQRSLKKINVIMVKDDFVPETCEYYLHFDVSRPLPKKNELKTDQKYFVKKLNRKKNRIDKLIFFFSKQNLYTKKYSFTKTNILASPKNLSHFF